MKKRLKEIINKKPVRDFLLYSIVGSGSTVVEWVLFYLLNPVFQVNYQVSTVIAYSVSTFCNWVLGRLILFKNVERGIMRDLLGIYAISIVGLLLNMLLMWLWVGVLDWNEMFSKVITTWLVFAWNYLMRKRILYKNNI